MIDNLISDLMEQIWINLDLYFNDMNFLIFGDFSEIFMNFL